MFSDIPGSRTYALDVTTGEVSVLEQDSRYSNGRTVDVEGRLVVCEHLGRRVIRHEPDGSVTVLADSFEGKRLNSPNDVVVSRDGTVWFTDPTYGILSDHEGRKADPEIGTGVYSVTPTGELRAQTWRHAMPNGLCFSPDESVLYVVDSGVRPGTIHAYPVHAGWLGEPRLWLDIPDGTADGIRCDAGGNVWAAVQHEELNGVWVISPAGQVLRRIPVPEMASNLCFAAGQLFVTAGGSLYSIEV